MFVIVQSWSNLPPDVVKDRGIPEAIGLALKHAVSLYSLTTTTTTTTTKLYYITSK